MIKSGGLRQASAATRIRVWERTLSVDFPWKTNYDYQNLSKVLNLDKMSDDKKSVEQESFTTAQNRRIL